jgi:hypothetical protein
MESPATHKTNKWQFGTNTHASPGFNSNRFHKERSEAYRASPVTLDEPDACAELKMRTNKYKEKSEQEFIPELQIQRNGTTRHIHHKVSPTCFITPEDDRRHNHMQIVLGVTGDVKTVGATVEEGIREDETRIG